MANENPPDEPAARVSERLRHRDRGVQAAGAGSDQGETPAAAGPAGVSDIGGDATLRGYDLMRPGAPSDPGGDSSTTAASTKHTRGICEWEPLTCLVVEDDDSVRGLCEQTLVAEGHEVVSAASAEEALELVAATGNGGGRVDLVITDVVMPGMDGAALARTLQGRLLDLDGQTPLQSRRSASTDAGGGLSAGNPSILLISGHDPAELGIDTDEFAFLAKPFSSEQLVAAASACCEGQTFKKVEVGRVAGPPPNDDGRDHHEADATQRIDVNNHRPEWYAEDGTVIDGDPEADAPRRDGPRLVGFGTFTVSKRVAAIAAAAGIAVLATAGLVLAGRGGEVELAGDDAGDVEIEEAAAADGERDAGEGHDPEGQTQDGDGNQQSGVVSGDDDQQTQAQSGSDNSQTATAEGDDNQQTQAQSGDAGTQAGGTAASEHTAAYEAPTVGAPQLTSCTTSRGGDDGTTEYAVAYTVATTGGTYDVLPDEPLIGNDQRLEVRGGDLTWTVETIHVREAGDEADPFYVAAPDVLGWAEPGGDVRQHAHQPPPLAVYVDQCRG